MSNQEPAGKILIGVPSYRNPGALRRCLDHIHKLDPLPGYRTRVLVADAGTAPADLDRIRLLFPAVEFRSTANRGYVGGVNEGLAEAFARGDDFLAVITDDVFADPSFLAQLVPPLAADSSAAVSGGKVFNQTRDGRGREKVTVIPGGFLGRDWFPRSRMIRPDEIKITACDWVHGAALVLKISAFRLIGPLDERFFMYFDELDLALSLRRHGYHALYVPSVVIRHESNSGFFGITARGGGAYARYYLTRNVALLYRKRSLFSFLYFLPYYLACAVLRSLLLLVKGRPGFALAVWRGLVDFFRGKYGPGPY
jgi:GT2 family glycosyltransferase